VVCFTHEMRSLLVLFIKSRKDFTYAYASSCSFRHLMDLTKMSSNVRNSALDLEPKGIVSYGFSASEHKFDSAKNLEGRYLSSQSGTTANGTMNTNSVPLETTEFDDLSLMPLGDLTLLPEAEETVFIYVATSMRLKYGIHSFVSRLISDP
jgi:hypothetical protein